MFKTLIARLKAFLTRLEHAAIGDVEKAMKPFKAILTKLETIKADATTLSSAAIDEALMLRQRAAAADRVAIDAVKKTEALKIIVG